MGASVQFFGEDNVMKAAENIDCPAWGIFINRNLFTKYEGDNGPESLQMLQKTLDALKDAGTAAIYTIKFFEGQPGTKTKINEKSSCDGGSFNFKLMEPEEREAAYISGSQKYGIIAELKKDIEQLKRERDQLDGDAPPETLGSIMIDLIKNPVQLGQLINIGRSLMGLPVNDYNAAIGAIPATLGGEGLPQDTRIDEVDRLSAAIDVLEKSDPRLVPHLEKLAEMSLRNPDQFKATVSMLDIKI